MSTDRDAAVDRRPSILVVDDDPAVRRLLNLELTAAGFDVQQAGDAMAARSSLQAGAPDAVVLDLQLPDVDGLTLLAEMKEGVGLPVVVLTSRTGGDARNDAFARGADDVITKPFSPAHVSSTLRSLLTIGTENYQRQAVLRAGKAEINLQLKQVRLGEALVSLSRSEWLLLQHLIESRGQPRLNQEILTSVWGPEYRDDVGYLDLWMRRLARKLGDESPGPRAIRRYRDVGYILDAR